jgi:hypothetical protein
MALTKSLHTVTATVNVARMLLSSGVAANESRADVLTQAALHILGYRYADFGSADPTVAAILKQVSKLVKV